MEHKPEVNPADLLDIDDALRIVVSLASWYAKKYKLPCLLTSIHSDPEPSDRTSAIHRDKRAVDVSCAAWPPLHRLRVKKFLNALFGAKWGSRGLKSKKPPQVCVYGDPAHLDHFHFQVRRDLLLHENDLTITNL